MRAHRIACPVGTTVFIMDYLSTFWSLQLVVSGGPTYSVSFTADDPNDTEQQGVTPTWFPFPAALTAAVTNQYFPNFAGVISAQPIRAIQIVVTVAGTVFLTVLQPVEGGI
jgi:hypothetical protein